MPVGAAIRTGIPRTSRPSSAVPASCAPPPVRMIPAGSMFAPPRAISPRISSNVSRIRASMISQTSRRPIVRPASSPRTDTVISSASATASRLQVPCWIFSSSATWRLVFRPRATSLVTLFPPIGRTAVRSGEPSANIARSIVPAPMSATATPSSFSVSDRTASPDARADATSSSILTPAALTHFERFWTAVAEPLTMWTSTSSRRALIPSGSLTPSWPSTLKPRRSTCRTSRLDGIETARATSMARLMSSRVTSRWWAVTATWPRELRLSTCWPPTPTKARSIFQPDSRSARSTESAIERTVWSMLMTTPFLSPEAGTVPWPMIGSRPSRLTSPMRAQTLLVPTSMPTRTASRSTVPFVSVRWSGLQEVAPDEGHVIEDAQAEGDEGHQVEIEAEPIADERQEHRDDGVDQEPADEDAIVVDPIELGPDRSEDRIERGEDRHGRIPTEFEPDVDIEDEAHEDTDEESAQGQQHGVFVLAPMVWPRLPDGEAVRHLTASCSAWATTSPTT